jgi:hypothetical protein
MGTVGHGAKRSQILQVLQYIMYICSFLLLMTCSFDDCGHEGAFGKFLLLLLQRLKSANENTVQNYNMM